MNEKMVKLKQQAELYGIDWDEFQRVAAVEGLGGGGHWAGVKFDEPVGRSSGEVNGVTHFEAAPGFGGFVRGKNVECGDFPERDLLDEDDDEDEDEL